MAAVPTLKSLRPPAPAPAALPAPSACARPVVLVVEDHDDTRFMLRVLLEMRGIEVVEAADGEEAVRATERARPCLVLMDGGLPQLDGLGAVRRMRESDGARDVPVVMLSGRAEPEYRARALASGCDGFLVKPFSVAQIDAVLERHGLRGGGGFAPARMQSLRGDSK